MRAHCEDTWLDGKVDRPFRRAGRRFYSGFQIGPGPDRCGLSTHRQRVNAHATSSRASHGSPLVRCIGAQQKNYKVLSNYEAGTDKADEASGGKYSRT